MMLHDGGTKDTAPFRIGFSGPDRWYDFLPILALLQFRGLDSDAGPGRKHAKLWVKQLLESRLFFPWI